MSAFEDVLDCGFSLADSLGKWGGAIDYLNVGAALARNGAGEQRLLGAWRAGKDDAMADGIGADAQEDVGVLERQFDQVARGFGEGRMSLDPPHPKEVA